MARTYEPHQQRVIDEKRELDERLEELNASRFKTPEGVSVSREEIGRLTEQAEVMSDYSKVLGARIANFDTPEDIMVLYVKKLGPSDADPLGVQDVIAIVACPLHRFDGRTASRVKLSEYGTMLRSTLNSLIASPTRQALDNVCRDLGAPEGTSVFFA